MHRAPHDVDINSNTSTQMVERLSVWVKKSPPTATFTVAPPETLSRWAFRLRGEYHARNDDRISQPLQRARNDHGSGSFKNVNSSLSRGSMAIKSDMIARGSRASLRGS